MRKKIVLENPERFSKAYHIPKMKIDGAIERALDKLEQGIPKWTDWFAGTCSSDFKYQQGTNRHWECGMQTGLYWLAYELSGNPKFREVAEKHLPTYQKRFEQKIGFGDHDVGFVYAPSCVPAYKVTGSESMKMLLLEVADYYYRTGYTEKGGFILRMCNDKDNEAGCRTMMDTLMNATFLFWAGLEKNEEKYTLAALMQSRTTEKYLIREDGSSFHHYQFAPGSYKPVRGLTFQGYADSSCWSRGHAWGIYGFALAYSYTREEFLVNLHRDVTYYMLNRLPDDLIPYWDLIFTAGEDQPRDSSAGAIAVCGMHEMCKLLSNHTPQKKIFEGAAARMLEAIIDHCTGEIGREYDGLLYHVTHAVPQKQGIDQCAIYGDYFYLEALLRFSKPEWKPYVF